LASVSKSASLETVALHPGIRAARSAHRGGEFAMSIARTLARKIARLEAQLPTGDGDLVRLSGKGMKGLQAALDIAKRQTAAIMPPDAEKPPRAFLWSVRPALPPPSAPVTEKDNADG
jgi:hypothetical protein